MKAKRTNVYQVLSKYEGLSGATPPDTLEVDFKKIVQELPFAVLQRHICLVLRSGATPAVSEIVASWYKSTQKSDRVRFVEILLAQPSVVWEQVRRLRSPTDVADLVSADDVARLISFSATTDPSVYDVVASFYARTPEVMLDLDRGVQREILKTLASNKNKVLEALDKSTGRIQLEDVAAEEVTSLGPETGGIEAAPPPRYASVQLFEEGEPWVKGDEFAVDQLFRQDHWYLAEVSVRLKPKGAPAQQRRPIREPRQSEPVDILVTAQSADFKISPRVSKLVLPKTGDSTQQALFRIMPLRHSNSADDGLRIRFRLFFQLNLLQVLTLRGGVLPAIEYDDEVPSWRPPALELVYAVQSDANDFDLMPARALHIEVKPDGQQYEMIFTFKRSGVHDELAIPAAVSLNASALAGVIAGTRKELFHIASSETLGKQLAGADWEYEEHLRALAKQGRNLWSLLFDRGEGQEISVAGEWLRKNPLSEGATIQVSVDERAASFVFSWSLLYDLTADSYQGFWGIRYVIEQRLIFPMPPAQTSPDPSEVEIGAMYWRFTQTPNQQEYLSDLVQQAKRARLALGGPIDEAKKAQQCITSRSSHIVYFYTHGHTALPDGEVYGVTVKDFLSLYNLLPVDSPTREAWKYAAEGIQDKQYRSDESWIELTSGRLLLTDLYQQVSTLPLRPFVILNMCDSAQVTPTLSQSFIDFFLTRGARAVIGTECSIRPVFADYVGRELLHSLLGAVPIGSALRRIRVEAAKQKNLLGLAYTLFGSADAALCPPLLRLPGFVDTSGERRNENCHDSNL